MLNRALRLMDVDIIIQMGFFIHDLHKNIADLHSKQFRGQNLSQTDFNQLKQNQGGLLAFNNFLSTSKNRKTSLEFIHRNPGQGDFVSVLFIMRIDPSIQNAQFANIDEITAVEGEEEILFSMHSVFRTGQIKQLPSSIPIWEVELTLTSDNDPELRELSDNIQKETSSNYTGWDRLGMLLIKLAKFGKAEELYRILLKQTCDQKERAYIFHQFGRINDNQGEYSKALEYLDRALNIWQRSLPANHPSVRTCTSILSQIIL